jgi:hypothetical protein
MRNVQFRVDAGRSKQTVEQTNRLLKAVSEIQLKFVRKSDAHSWFEQTLQTFLDVTDSEYGVIETVRCDDHGLPQLQTQAGSDIAWDRALGELYEPTSPNGLQLQNLKALFGETLRTGDLLISNSDRATFIL